MSKLQADAKKYAKKVGPILKKLKRPTIPYGRLMNKVGLSHRNPYHRRIIGSALERVSIKSWNDKRLRFLLSARAVYKHSERPNDAFFELAGNLGAKRRRTSKEKFWVKQMDKIKEKYGPK